MLSLLNLQEREAVRASLRTAGTRGVPSSTIPAPFLAELRCRGEVIVSGERAYDRVSLS